MKPGVCEGAAWGDPGLCPEQLRGQGSLPEADKPSGQVQSTRPGASVTPDVGSRKAQSWEPGGHEVAFQ